MLTTAAQPGSSSPSLAPALSSLSTKYLMALTGAGLTLFVLFHMIGNWQVFMGAEALNKYAALLKSMGPLLWIGRIGLLLLLACHVGLAIKLRLHNQAARPVPYVCFQTIKATLASRTMVLTGLTILAFVLFHLAHFTLGWTHPDYFARSDSQQRHDVYSMVVLSFREPGVSVSYVVAMLFLGMHLWHGASSLFQSLGINHPRYERFLECIGPTVASLVVIGNCSMPLSILFGLVGGDVK